MFFPTVVLGTMNAVLSPVVQGTEMMVHQQEGNLAELTAKRDKLQEEAYLGILKQPTLFPTRSSMRR